MTDFIPMQKVSIPPLSQRIGDICSFCDRHAVGTVKDIDTRGMDNITELHYCQEHEAVAKSWRKVATFT